MQGEVNCWTGKSDRDMFKENPEIAMEIVKRRCTLIAGFKVKEILEELALLTAPKMHIEIDVDRAVSNYKQFLLIKTLLNADAIEYYKPEDKSIDTVFLRSFTPHYKREQLLRNAPFGMKGEALEQYIKKELKAIDNRIKEYITGTLIYRLQNTAEFNEYGEFYD